MIKAFKLEYSEPRSARREEQGTREPKSFTAPGRKTRRMENRASIEKNEKLTGLFSQSTLSTPDRAGARSG